MHILTTISYYIPHLSGLTICTQRLIAGLSKRGFLFTALTCQHDRSLAKLEKQEGVTIRRIPVWVTLGKVPIMPLYLLALLQEMRQADVVWIHLPQAEGILTAILAKLTRKPVVTTMHCLPLLPSGWQRLMFQRLFDFLNNLMIRLADRVVYYTKDYAENTKELLHIPRKSHYIFPPILSQKITDYPSTSSSGPRGRLPITDYDSLTVGFAGRIAEDKGIEYLLTALQLIKEREKNVQLIVAGPHRAIGERLYRRKIWKLVKDSGVMVKFLGSIPPDKMSKFYKKIDVLVLPSVNRTEAFGMVQVEAMKHGVPVVASALPGVRVPVQLTKAGAIVPLRNPQRLAQGILKAFDTFRGGTDRKAIAKNALAAFPLKKTLDTYERVLRQVYSEFRRTAKN